jgi:hypothetical protein
MAETQDKSSYRKGWRDGIVAGRFLVHRAARGVRRLVVRVTRKIVVMVWASPLVPLLQRLTNERGREAVLWRRSRSSGAAGFRTRSRAPTTRWRPGNATWRGSRLWSSPRTHFRRRPRCFAPGRKLSLRSSATCASSTPNRPNGPSGRTEGLSGRPARAGKAVPRPAHAPRSSASPFDPARNPPNGGSVTSKIV